MTPAEVLELYAKHGITPGARPAKAPADLLNLCSTCWHTFLRRAGRADVLDMIQRELENPPKGEWMHQTLRREMRALASLVSIHRADFEMLMSNSEATDVVFDAVYEAKRLQMLAALRDLT